MSTFGRYFRVSTFGESHCAAVGAVVDGVPPGLPFDEGYIQRQLNRRRPGQSHITTQRKEKDIVSVLSGVENGHTLGSPIGLLVNNEDHRPKDYSFTEDSPRPSHADLTYAIKYVGRKSQSGGGRSSARETVGRVAAGAIAELWLRHRFGVEVVAYVESVGSLRIPASVVQEGSITRDDVDAFACRCPHPETAQAIEKYILELKESGNSVGGVIRCIVRNVPPGWGEPSFDKLEAVLAHAMLSIPATKGFEVGSGFGGAEMTGQEHNDAFAVKNTNGKRVLGTTTNNSGGIQGGISNGESIMFRVAFKPPATISLPQSSVNYNGLEKPLEAVGRHDPAVVPRAVVIVEAMACLALADAALAQLSRIPATIEAGPYLQRDVIANAISLTTEFPRDSRHNAKGCLAVGCDEGTSEIDPTSKPALIAEQQHHDVDQAIAGRQGIQRQTTGKENKNGVSATAKEQRE